MCKVYTSLRDNIYQQMIDRMILFVTRADSRRSGMTSLCGQGSVPVLYRLTRQSLSAITMAQRQSQCPHCRKVHQNLFLFTQTRRSQEHICLVTVVLCFNDFAFTVQVKHKINSIHVLCFILISLFFYEWPFLHMYTLQRM